MKKMMLRAMLLMAIVFLGTGSAMAEPVTFNFDGLWDWGSTYTFDGTSTYVYDAGNPNPYSGTTGSNLVSGIASAPDTNEDSYGVSRVLKAFPTGGGADIYNVATSPYELTLFFYGFDDVYIKGYPAPSTFVKLLSDGGHAVIYQDYAKNFNASDPLGPEATPTGGRSGFGSFDTVTDGTMVLDLTPRALVGYDDLGNPFYYTLDNTFSFAGSSGFGEILFDVTGGTWADMYNTNTQDYGTDIKFNFSAFPADGSSWIVQGVGNARTNVVPEPATMLLFGVGMASMAAVRARRKKTV